MFFAMPVKYEPILDEGTVMYLLPVQRLDGTSPN